MNIHSCQEHKTTQVTCYEKRPLIYYYVFSTISIWNLNTLNKAPFLIRKIVFPMLMAQTFLVSTDVWSINQLKGEKKYDKIWQKKQKDDGSEIWQESKVNSEWIGMQDFFFLLKYAGSSAPITDSLTFKSHLLTNIPLRHLAVWQVWGFYCLWVKSLQSNRKTLTA